MRGGRERKWEKDRRWKESGKEEKERKEKRAEITGLTEAIIFLPEEETLRGKQDIFFYRRNGKK